MEQTSNNEKHIPTYKEIMTMIHETQRITRVHTEEFDRRMKEEEQARQKYREEYERESKKTDKIIRKMSENFISQSGHIVEQGDADAICNHPQTDYTQKLINAIPKGILE